MKTANILLLMLVCLFATTAYAITPKQAAMQSAFSGWGDVGEVGIVDSPTNGGSGSLKVHWTSHPNYLLTAPFWVLSWPAQAKGYDTISFDLLVEQNSKANLSIYLSEADGDRWMASPDLARAGIGKWTHFEFSNSQMGLWALGNNKRDWDSIGSITLEPGGAGGEIVFYLDNIVLSGPSGTRNLLDSANLPKPYSVPPTKKAPLNTTDPHGHAFIAGGGTFWTTETTAYSLDKMCGLSPSIGISSGGYLGEDKSAALSDRMKKLGRPLMEEHGDAIDFSVELTEAQAWCVRWDGESNNKTPGKFDIMHSACFCNPKYIEMNKRRIDAILAGGINTLTFVDFVWPYFGGRWGYSDADITAYRKALLGTDGGLLLIEKSGKRNISFWDYYKDYSGFILSPKDLGYTTWNEYTPVSEQEAWADIGPKRKNMGLFVVLMHWEYMKFLQTLGLYAESKGGHIWIIPNPEDLGGAEDYVYLGHLAGLQGNFAEFFGNPMWTDAIYRSGGYLSQNVHEAGHLIGPQLEINAGGHGKPYYDAPVSYAVAYDLCASLQADVLKNDFMDESPFDVTSDPKNQQQFDRFRDTMSKVYAFDQYKTDNPLRAKSKIAVVTPRNINRYRGDLFYGFYANEKSNDGCMAEALAKEGYIFDLMDATRYAPLESHSMIFWGMPDMPGTLVARISKWLLSSPKNVFVCHSNQPTSRNTGVNYPSWITPQTIIEHPNGGKAWGLPAISKYDGLTTGLISFVGKPFVGAFKKGDSITIPTDVYVAKGGKVLLSLNGIPIVSEFTMPNGSRTIYLHYKAGEPESVTLDRKIGSALAKYYAGAKKLANSVDEAIVHSYAIRGGASYVVWARKPVESWEFIYDGNRSQRLTYTNPGFEASVRVPVQKPGRYIVYDTLSNTENEVPVTATVPLTLRNVNCAVYYVLPANASNHALIAKMKAKPIHELLSK
jgi:hypothetical protein